MATISKVADPNQWDPILELTSPPILVDFSGEWDRILPHGQISWSASQTETAKACPGHPHLGESPLLSSSSTAMVPCTVVPASLRGPQELVPSDQGSIWDIF